MPRNTQNVSAIVGCGFVPIKFLHLDRVYGLATRLQDSDSSLVHEALQVMEGQGASSMFFKQAEELITGLESWEDYLAYREDRLNNYVDRELQAVKKTTFMFIPQGSLSLEEPPYSLIPEDLVGEMNKFLFMNAGLGNRCPTKEGIKFKTCALCLNRCTSFNE